jgi:L,D-transpeptidase catalytic domain
MWLRGLEAQNAHAYQRCIYIHGTPEENKLGRPASYGCIRMKASDVADLYNRVPPGALVQITPDPLPKLAKAKVPRSETSNGIVAAAPPPPPPPPPPQIQAQNPEPLPKVAKAPRPQPTNSVVAATSLAAPPEHLTLDQPEAQNATENHQTGTRKNSGSLTVDQMRMSGALAAQRQKSKLAGLR